MNTDMVWSDTKVLTPRVDQTREFLEIATDFANPLDIVREAISNSYDAKCTEIYILFDVIQKYGEHILRIVIEDNGEGMSDEDLQTFFDLGSSQRRTQKSADPSIIGEKGHGTKIYFNSDSVEVLTAKSGKLYSAKMDQPFAQLHENVVPKISVKSKANAENFKGTKIEILGYNRNRRELFSHDILRDHIIWFTKHGSFESQFNKDSQKEAALHLRGVDRKESELITCGHNFPKESASVDKLFDHHGVYAPDHYCKKWVRQGHLPEFPDISYQAVFYLEGDKVKKENNPMLGRRGQPRKPGSYQVQERYGLWISRDYIPIQRKNEWITTKGAEYTKFHAFINCQTLRLTANRGSIENTPAEILQSIERVARSIYNDIVESDDWTNLEWLEQQVSAYQTAEKEQKEFDRRVSLVKNIQTARYKNITLVEPRQENGVYAIVVALQAIDPKLFPFDIVDYDTHNGIDVIAKTRDNVDVGKAHLRYIEFKHTLTDRFNHSFRFLHSIVCWKTQVQHDQTVEDIAGQERRMVLTPRSKPNEHSRYMLDDPKSTHKIEVYVLEEYLKDKLGIAFSSKTST